MSYYTNPYDNKSKEELTAKAPVTADNKPAVNDIKKPANQFEASDSIFAWLSFILAYFFCRAFPISEYPLGGLIVIVLMFAAATIILKLKGASFTPLSIAVAASALVISSSLLISSNAFICFITCSYAALAYCYYVYAACGNSIKQGFNDFIIADFFKALFVVPFCSFGCMFRAMFSGKAKSGGKTIVKVILGVAVAFIPTIIVVALLSYDTGFTDLLLDIFSFDFDAVFNRILSLGFAVPISLYVFGLYVSSVNNKASDVLCEKKCRKFVSKIRFAPAISVTAAVIPLLFLYVVFFISQWKYYVSAFTNVLPKDFSYADYAREGFFQLCAVSFINLLVILSVLLFMKRKSFASSLISKVITILFSLSTLVLISTALAKMVMYINTYGLTQKRVYATWLMILIGLIFILICVRLFIRKFKVIAVTFALCVVAFGLLAIPNVDAIIAEYNVDRYLEGTLQSVDLEAMEDLGISSVAPLVKLYKSVDPDSSPEAYSLYFNLYNTLDSYEYEIMFEEYNIFKFTFAQAKAENALREIGII